MNKLQILTNGIIKENPALVLLLGMCPTLGTTTSAINGMGMGLATMAVLMCSNVVISAVKNLIPDMVRIPSFIVIIATFVTVLEMLMKAYVPSLYASLGLFIPLWLTALCWVVQSLSLPRTLLSIRSSMASAAASALRWLLQSWALFANFWALVPSLVSPCGARTLVCWPLWLPS